MYHFCNGTGVLILSLILIIFCCLFSYLCLCLSFLHCHQCIFRTGIWLYSLCLGGICRLCRSNDSFLYRRTEKISYSIWLEINRKICSCCHRLVFDIRKLAVRKCMGFIDDTHLLVVSICGIHCEKRFPVTKLTYRGQVFQIELYSTICWYIYLQKHILFR